MGLVAFSPLPFFIGVLPGGLAVLLGSIGLHQVNRSGGTQRGDFLALVGIVLGGLAILTFVAFMMSVRS